MAKSYEELMGSLGKSVYFRPERRRVRELLSRDAEPELLLGDKKFPLFDVSLTGLSISVGEKERELFPAGADLNITVTLHGDPLFSGKARVARHEPGHRSLRVGLALVDGGILDIPEFLRRDEENRLATELRNGADSLRAQVPSEYQYFIERVGAFVQYYKTVLGRHEARIREEHPGSIEPIEKLAKQGYDALWEPWMKFVREGSRLATQMLGNPAQYAAAKRYTEMTLTPQVLDAPVLGRAYHKPLGYPGDYQIMQYYYENAFRGPSAAAMVFHRFITDHPLSAGCRTRKDFVMEKLFSAMKAHGEHHRGSKESFQATSLGCGPAREVVDFANQYKNWPVPVNFTLMDQEDEALSHAYQTGRKAMAQNGHKGSVECLHVSFSQLLNDPTLFPAVRPHNFIYSVGLFDYLRESRGQELVAALYEKLAPGGTMLVGNASAPNDWFWAAEFLLDWTLLYRTDEEVRRLAAKLPPNATVSVELEPGKAYYFLCVKKP